MNIDNRANKIRQLLTAAFSPTQCEIINEDELHHGHTGSAGGAGHFALTIASEKFHGKSLVECHRMIYQVLDEMMKHDIHALKIKLVK